MHRFKHILVGLTRTETDASLIRYAAMIARLGTANEIHFVHVLPQQTVSAVSVEAILTHDAVRAEMEAEVRDHFTDVPETAQRFCHVLRGPLLDRFLDFAAEKQVDLILLGHQRSHNVRRSLARRLAMKAPCSVWMVPERTPTEIRNILVPTDYSEHSADALGVATSLAKGLGIARCLALHVYFNEATTTFEEYEEVLHDRDEQAFERFLAPLNTYGVRVAPLVEEGAIVSHVVNRVARREHADLIVINTRGRSQSSAILLGSVAEQILLESEVPVLVVKHFGARMSVLQALLDKAFRHKGDRSFGG
jgi:nucleotide-binding universal stress UspA family protein